MLVTLVQAFRYSELGFQPKRWVMSSIQMLEVSWKKIIKIEGALMLL